MRLHLLIFATGVLMLAACSPSSEAETVYGRWTPVAVDDCDDVVVTIRQGEFAATVSGAPAPFSIGETVRVERARPGFVDVVYHPTIYGADAQPIGAADYTETVRFQLIEEGHIRGVGHFPRASTQIGPLPLESAHVLDITRCPDA